MSSLRGFPFASSADRSARWLVFAAVFAIALSFAAYTNHAWEDYYITYRVSKNLATGHGLVYTVGERVHAFTSPINVLVPAVLSIITGNTSDGLVLWLFRIVSAAVLAAAAVPLFEIARKNSLSLIPAAVMVGLFGLDAKIVDFSINGQETAFMMFFLALTLHALTVPSRWTILKLGLAWTGLMWTRPDGFIYFGAVALGFVLFNAGQPIAQSRLRPLKVFLCAGAITTVLYSPWVLWAWHYYGSPIPHTITAKGYVFGVLTPHSGSRLINVLTFPIRMLLGDTAADGTFLPAYASALGGWHWTAMLYGKCLAYLCAFYWCVPSARAAARAVSFAFLLSLYYLSDIACYPAPWYVPNCAILAIFVLAHAAQHGLDFAASLKGKDDLFCRRSTAGIRGLGALVLSATLLLTLCAAYQLRIQQRLIEDGHRKQIGLWLRQNASSPSDSVFLEPLGYIGYFSQLKMLDWPGLCAPEVVAAEKKLHTSAWPELILQLRPDWLVLEWERVAQMQQARPQLLTQLYSSVKVFDVSERIAAYQWLPGRGYLAVDQTFAVFKRNKASTAVQSRN